MIYNSIHGDIMGQWVELELRKEQFDLIISCLESKCCQSNDYLEIERYVYLIDDLENQEMEYCKKMNDLVDI